MVVHCLEAEDISAQELHNMNIHRRMGMAQVLGREHLLTSDLKVLHDGFRIVEPMVQEKIPEPNTPEARRLAKKARKQARRAMVRS